MNSTNQRSVYEELGVTRIINARGNATLVGGSTLSPTVTDAMKEANEYYVEMEDLLEKSGVAVAKILGAEAALITSGCFAALVLGASAIMAGRNPANVAQLPNTIGMKNEFLIQKRMRYQYDRCVSVPGGKLVEVGDHEGTTKEQLEHAISPATAGVLYLARNEGMSGVLSIPEVVSIAKKAGIAVLVDAAGEVYPLDRMTWLPRSGADLICFGAKYIGSPHSTGMLCGLKDMVDAAVFNNFISYEAQGSNSLGRGYKVDRQDIVATVVSLQEWFKMNHEERFMVQERRIQIIARELADIPNVEFEHLWDRHGPWMSLRLTIDELALEKTVDTIVQELKNGDPSIWVRVEENQIYVFAHTLQEGEDKVVARKMRQVLQ